MSPPHEVTEIFAFLAVDGDGDEGVPATRLGDMLMPLAVADQARLEEVRPIAQRLASSYGMKVAVARFTQREDIEILLP